VKLFKETYMWWNDHDDDDDDKDGDDDNDHEDDDYDGHVILFYMLEAMHCWVNNKMVTIFATVSQTNVFRLIFLLNVVPNWSHIYNLRDLICNWNKTPLKSVQWLSTSFINMTVPWLHHLRCRNFPCVIRRIELRGDNCPDFIHRRRGGWYAQRPLV